MHQQRGWHPYVTRFKLGTHGISCTEIAEPNSLITTLFETNAIMRMISFATLYVRYMKVIKSSHRTAPRFIHLPTRAVNLGQVHKKQMAHSTVTFVTKKVEKFNF